MNQANEQRGYPLAALFILIAACGSLLAMAAPLAPAIASGKAGFSDTVYAAITGALVTEVLGMIVGFFHCRQPYGLIVGGAVGFILGALLFPLMLIPVDDAAALLGAAFLGSFILVLMSAAVRVVSVASNHGKLGATSKSSANGKNASEIDAVK